MYQFSFFQLQRINQWVVDGTAATIVGCIMNIAVLSSISRSAGGVRYAVQYLSKALAQHGCESHMFSVRDGFSNEDLLAWNPLSVELYAGIGPLCSSIRLRQMLASLDADLVHVHGLWKDQQWAALQWQKHTNKPVIVSPHGMLDPWALRNSAWKKRIVEKLFARDALDRATCIHALCISEVDAIRSYGLKNPVALIPNGVELPSINISTSENHSPNRKKRLLFLGRIHPKKGLSELISGWEQAGLAEWELLIAGPDDGGHMPKLKKLIKKLGVGASVSFLGPLYGKDKDHLLRESDAFILPSFSEGLPMSVLEAWSYGLPAIISEYCNLPEGIDHGAALLIEPSVESVARGLIQLGTMSDADLLEMGAAGRALVERRFTWDKIAQDMASVYHWSLSGGNPPNHVLL